VFTHISARVPGPEHHFLINPYGMLFEEITASKPDQGRRARQQGLAEPVPGEPSGLRHPQRHPRRTKRRDLRPAYAYARRHRRRVAADGLLPISQQATVALCSLGYHGYEASRSTTTRSRGFSATSATTPRSSCAPRPAHGRCDRRRCVPRNVPLQRAARSQIAAQSSGAKLIPISPHIVAGVKSNLALVTKAWGRPRGPGLLQTRPDDPSYRQMRRPGVRPFPRCAGLRVVLRDGQRTTGRGKEQRPSNGIEPARPQHTLRPRGIAYTDVTRIPGVTGALRL